MSKRRNMFWSDEIELSSRSGTPERSPEIRLIRAILDDAVQAIVQSTDRRRRDPGNDDATAAAAWMRDDNREWPFAFLNICDLLGLDADAVRERLAARRHQAAHRRAE